MLGQTKQNVQDVMQKIGIMDALLQSLEKIHADDEDTALDLQKKLSARKLVLMGELFTLLS